MYRGKGKKIDLRYHSAVYVCVCVGRDWASSFQVLNELTDFYETSYERYFSGEHQIPNLLH